MRQLFIHMGYPKTGSTALQENVFTKLESLGLINYLGKSYSKKELNGPFMKLSNYLTYSSESPDIEVLKSGVINVYSEERILLDGILFGRNDLNDSFGLNYLCDRLDLFLSKNNIEASLIVVIRNQADLLFSTYLHNLYKPKVAERFSSFEDYIDYLLNSEHRNHFDFNNLIERLKNITNVREVNVLIYEDLKENVEFTKNVLNILGLDEKICDKISTENKFGNKKYSNDSVQIERVNVMRNTKKKIPFLAGLIIKSSPKTKSFFKRVLKSLGFVHVEKVPKMRDETKKKIMSNYKESNEKLSMLLDNDKMKLYNYF